MPHFPKPFFRASRGLWYVQIDGKQVNLGNDRDAAFVRYHQLMGAPKQPIQLPIAGEPVVGIIDEFLDWCQKHKARDTYRWYVRRTQPFVLSISPALTVAELKPIHLTRWVDSHPNWNNGTKRGSIIAVVRAFNWAEKQGLIDRNPLRGVEKPEAGVRELVLTQTEFDLLLRHVKDQAFRDLLTAAWETGARPQELLRVEARHVDLAHARWVFPKQESKGKKRSRTVYLNDRALEITCRLMLRSPSGPIFRNSEGTPWTPYAVNCRFRRLRVEMGLTRIAAEAVEIDVQAVLKLAEEMIRERKPDFDSKAPIPTRTVKKARRLVARKLALNYVPKYCLYTFRHSFATRLLESGVDALTVSTLLGHADMTMLSRVYSHLIQKPVFLREALQKVSG